MKLGQSLLSLSSPFHSLFSSCSKKIDPDSSLIRNKQAILKQQRWWFQFSEQVMISLAGNPTNH